MDHLKKKKKIFKKLVPFVQALLEKQGMNYLKYRDPQISIIDMDILQFAKGNRIQKQSYNICIYMIEVLFFHS